MRFVFPAVRVVLLLGILLIWGLGGHPSLAAVYKYKDENGAWHFSDAPVNLPEDGETMAGMIERRATRVDLRTQITMTLSPQNDIEKAVGATVAIKSTIGSGSGFFVTADGHILTNKHVLQFSDDQEQQADSFFDEAAGRLRELETALEQEETQLDKARGDLEKMKSYVDSQPESSVKEINRSRYLAELQSVVSWEENYLKRKKQFALRKKELWDKKIRYDRDASVAALSRTFTITLADNTELHAYLVKRSNTYDLALLKVDGYITPFLEPALFRASADGDPVYAIGNPLNLRNSVASGILSGFEGDYAKTDAKIYPGNSGGPLVTRDGKVIGVNTFKKITHKFEGLGFAITIERALAEFGEFLR